MVISYGIYKGKFIVNKINVYFVLDYGRKLKDSSRSNLIILLVKIGQLKEHIRIWNNRRGKIDMGARFTSKHIQNFVIDNTSLVLVCNFVCLIDENIGKQEVRLL